MGDMLENEEPFHSNQYSGSLQAIEIEHSSAQMPLLALAVLQ
jgi:hypothetical protein